MFSKCLLNKNLNKFSLKDLFFQIIILLLIVPLNIDKTFANKLIDIGNSANKVSSNKEYQLPNLNGYILGPGDEIFIELLDIKELSGIYQIGPTGYIYLPRLRDIKAEGYSIDEFRIKITNEYSKYLINPNIYIRPTKYRAIRVYVGGEVSKPGFYTLTEGINTGNANLNTSPMGSIRSENLISNSNFKPRINLFPTVFDAIKISQGVTPYSDLSNIQIIRKISKGNGGGLKKTNVSILPLLTKGDDSQNIRLYDNDVIQVRKSDKILKDQLLSATRSNLSPDKIIVFVSGRVRLPGQVIMPQGSSLNEALIAADGPKILRGSIEFVRFKREGKVERRIFDYSPGNTKSSYQNPVLMDGDLIRVQDNLLSATSTVLGEFTQPFIGIYSIFNFFNDLF